MKTTNKMQDLLDIVESRLDNKKTLCATYLEQLYKSCLQEDFNADIYFNPISESTLNMFNKQFFHYIGKDLSSNQKDILNNFIIYNRAFSSLQDLTLIKKSIESAYKDYEDWEDYFLFTIYDKNSNVYYDFVYEIQNGGYLNKYEYAGSFSEACNSYVQAFNSETVYFNDFILLVHNKNRIDEIYKDWLDSDVKTNIILIYIRRLLFSNQDTINKIKDCLIRNTEGE